MEKQPATEAVRSAARSAKNICAGVIIKQRLNMIDQAKASPIGFMAVGHMELELFDEILMAVPKGEC